MAVLPVLRLLVVRFSVPPEQPWRSECDSCGRRVWPDSCGPFGHCAGCRRRVGAPAWTLEVAVFVVMAAVALSGLPGWEAAAMGWWAVFGLVLSFVDVAVHRLPTVLIAAMTAGTVVLLAGAAAWSSRWSDLAVAVMIGVGVAVSMAALSLVAPGGLGLGDAQLGLPVGLLLGWWGWQALVSGVVLVAAVGFVVAIVLLVLRRVSMRSSLPYGPVLVAGAFIAALLAAAP